MNCSRFRFLIQQKFDMDLAPQEERVVVAHLESCESCAKFHHQLQQVILAAEEVPLPDEMLPQKEGELARLIQQQLPQAKASPFAFLEDFLSKFTGKKNQAQQPAESPFPHRSNLGAMGDGNNGSKKKGVFAAAEAEDHNAMGSRLKQMNRNQGEQDTLTGSTANNYESREMQSQTRSLGEKFGMAAPSESGEEHGLTLAESIRRKISETTKPPGEDFEDQQQQQQPPMNSDSWQGAPQPGFAPPPGAQGGFANPNQSFQGGPGGQGGFAPPQQNFQGAPAAAFANAPQAGFANAPQGAFQSAAQGGQGAPGFGQSPFEPAAQVAQPPMGWAAPAQDSGSAWGAPQPNNVGNQGAQDQGNWGAAAWDQGAPGAPAGQAPTSNQEWSGQNNAPAAWNAPPPADNAQGWTTPTNPSMQAPQAAQAPQALQQGGGANPGWGAPIQAPSQAADSWQGVQQNAAPVQSPVASDSWAGGSNQAPAAFAANPATDSWAGGGNPQPVWGQPAGHDWNSQPGAQNSPPAQAPQIPPSMPSTSNGWEQPAPAPTAAGAAWGDAPKGAAWGQPSDANNWGGPGGVEGNGAEAVKPEVKRAMTAPAYDLKAELVETGTWTAFKPAEPLSPRMTPALPKAEAPPAGQAAPADNRWDIPIQERMKMQNAGVAPVAPSAAPVQPAAFAPSAAPVQPAAFAPPAMPAPQPSPPQAPAQAAAPAGWDYSAQQGGQAGGNPAEGGHTKSGWDFPVYESDDVLTGPGWGAPPKPAQAEVSNTGMGELGAAIGDVARGAAQPNQAPVAPAAAPAQAAAPAPNSWDLSIQERQQLQQQQAAAQIAPPEQQFAPAQPAQQAAAPAWGQPPAQAQQATSQDQNGWGAPAEAPTWGAPPQAAQPVAPIAPPVAPTLPIASDSRQKLFAPIDDNAMDKLFSDHLGIQDAAPVNREAAPAQPPAFQDPSRAAANWEQQQPPAAAAAPQWGAPPAFAPGNGQSTPNGGGYPAATAAPAAPAPIPVPAAAPAPPAKAGLFNLGDDDMDKLFGDHLGIQEPSQAQANPAPEPQNVGQGQQGSSTWNKLEPQNPQQELTNPGWGQPPAQPAPPAWGQPPAAQVAPQQSGQWGSPPAPNDAPAWGAPPAGAAPAWGQPPAAPQAPAAPAQPPANPFAAMANNQYGQPASAAPQISPVQTSAQSPASAAPQKPANAGLFSIDDSVIDKIFSDNLGVSEGQSRPASGADPVSQSAPPPKIEGVGRLDSRVDHNQDAGSGRISSIGKFLLDQKDMEKLGKLSAADLSDSSMKILTQEAAGELTTLLHHIASQNAAVVGSVIVGHDGLLIANTMPPDIEAESVGVWALGVYMNTAHVVKKMGQNRVHQIVSKTPKGYLVIADFGGGLLVVVSDGKDTDTLIPLMRSITQLVVQ